LLLFDSWCAIAFASTLICFVLSETDYHTRQVILVQLSTSGILSSGKQMVIADLTKLKQETSLTEKLNEKRVTLGIHQYNPLSRCRTNFVQTNQRYLYSYKNSPGGKSVFFFVFPACFLLSILTFLRNRGILLIIYY